MNGSKLEAALQRLTQRSVPGLAAVMVERGHVVETSAAGLRDLTTGSPTTLDTVHLWFSMTKIVTATAVMQLAERGALSLDDRVARFFPQFPAPPKEWPEIRVRHLLSHSAGLANPPPIRWIHAADEDGRDPHEFALELVERYRRLRAPAGSRAQYSNLGYIVLGEAIAAAAGQSYEDYVRSHILRPLSLTRTDFSYEDVDTNIATGYQRRLSPMTPVFRVLLPKGIVGRRVGRFVAFNRFYVDGPAYGGLLGSARDAARFMAAHLNGGELEGVRLLSAESVDEMQTIQASIRKLDVGFGWFRRGSDRSLRTLHLEHLGGGGGFWNMMRIYPERGVGVIAMGNATRYDHEVVARSALAGV